MSTARTLLALTALSGAMLAANPMTVRAGPPSFNCADAQSRAEQLICGDKELALMDVEASRLFKLVRDREGVPGERRKTLNDDRTRWQKVRDECWISGDLRGCIIAAYAIRIHALRENHAEARANDQDGITKGPFKITCKDLEGPVRATFISSNPPVGALQLRERVHVGIGTGARYVEPVTTGGITFWTSGEAAYLNMPNGMRYECALDRS
jgi:uncharacterized protein